MNTSQTATSGAESFWRGILAGFTTATPLPAGLRASERGGVRGRQSASLRLRAAAATALRDFAQDASADIPAAVAAAWAICLSRFSNQEDVLFGFTLDATTPVPLRLRLDSDRPLKAWLSEVASQLKTVSEYGAPSADELRAWSGQAAHGPLFDTVVRFVSGQTEGERFPLVIRVSSDSSEGLDVVTDFDGERFSVGAIPNVLDSFAMVLEAMAESSSERRVAELPLVSAGQAAHLMRWNDTGAGYDGGKCVHEFVEEQARRTPNHIAVTFQDRSVTYEELDRRSNHLAQHLRALGAGPDQIVAICLERSVEMMVGLLGILKSGAAYLPLDPAYPLERLQFMLEDSGALVLLTREHLLPQFPELQKPVVQIDADWRQVESRPGASLGRTAESGNLAYVIYTSGSTGKPKGVMIEHRQVSNFFTGMDRVIGPEPGAWLAVTSISFDISVLELFWTLARGFHLVLQAEGSKLSTEGDFAIPAQVARHGITHLQCTPSMARLLVSSAESRRALARLQKLLVGGEAFPATLAADLSAATTGEIHNMYGPTETTIWSTTYRVAGGESTIPIGRPIANTLIYILDKNLKLLPIGAPGELCIGGAGVVRGYLHRQELTRERFPENPFRPAERMYRTGDLARFRPDGDIEFIGRVDNQIKILGFRVELEEIEAVLGQHPGVRAAAVIVREDVPGEPRLAAYVVAAEAQRSLAKELRIYLQQKLPANMLPSTFVFLDSLPATPNGKTNRKALAALAPPLEEPSGVALTPAAMEELIGNIWKEVLGVDEVSPTGNISDLGANSLTTIEATSRLREACQREIAVTDLFQHPTIRALAAYLVDPANSAPLSRGPSRALSRRDAMLREIL
jgi:amino acid adenylation domain-containing protein